MSAAAIPLMIAGMGLKMYGQYRKGKAAEAQADYNAEVARRQAKATKARGNIEQYKLKRQKRLASGKQKSLYSKAGLLMKGTPLEVLADTASQYDLDLATSRYNTKLGVSKYGYESDYRKYTGKQAMNSAYVNMGGTLLTGSAGVAKYKRSNA